MHRSGCPAKSIYLCRILVSDTGRATPEDGNRFYTAAGFEHDQMDYYHKMFGMFGKFVSHIPESYQRIKDADKIMIGANEWEVIVGRGHSPGTCLPLLRGY